MPRHALLAFVLTACSGAKAPVVEDFGDLAGLDTKSDAFSSRIALAGTIEYGQTASLTYHSPPRFAAFKLIGKKGERVVIDVRSADGDPVTWLLDGSFRVIASNDDAGPDTRDSHIEAALPANLEADDVGYYVVVRDYDLADASFSVASAAPAHDVDTWLGRSIYFVVTDRFVNGDPANDDADGFASDPRGKDAWHGGDFQGLIDHLDYIAGMGFTGLWITPVVQQHHAHAYHGYWGWDWSRIDGHLGDLAKLRELVQAAHARGIAVMIDTVANHTGRYGHSAPTFPDASMYHHNGNIIDYSNLQQVEGNDLNGLNDLAQEDPVVAQKLYDHVRWLVSETGLDGLRLDTVKHVPKAFWTRYSRAAGVFTIGEVLDGNAGTVGSYTQAIDATLDYPLYFAVQNVFAQSQSARKLGALFAQDGAYARPLTNGLFVDNHDQARFLCTANGARDVDRQTQLELALALTFTARGIPVLYYGTEQGLHDCADNRQDMAALDTGHPLYRYVQRLNQARSSSAALRTGAQLERWKDDTVYAFEREAGASAALVTFNLGSAARTITMRHMHVPAGTVLSDALGGGSSATVTAAQEITVEVPTRSVLILTND